MIVPCNTTTPVVFQFIPEQVELGYNTEITVTPYTYNIGPVDSTGTLCHGAFISRSSFSKQSLLGCSAHHSHVE